MALVQFERLQSLLEQSTQVSYRRGWLALLVVVWSHLKFIEGELQEQVKIGALLNNLAIEPLHDKWLPDSGSQKPGQP